MPGIAIGEGTHDCAVVVLALAHCASTEAFVGQRMCDAFTSRRWHEIYDGVRNRVEALQGRAVEGFGVNRTVWQAEAVALGLRRVETGVLAIARYRRRCPQGRGLGARLRPVFAMCGHVFWRGG